MHPGEMGLFGLVLSATAEDTLAESLFNSYNNEPPSPWKTFDGRDVPRWVALSEQVKTKWRAVARHVIKGLAGDKAGE